MSDIIRALDWTIALAFATIGILLVTLTSQIGFCLELHEINAKLSAFNSQLTATSDKIR